MRNLFKKATATALALTMVVGLTGVTSAAVKKGTDVATGTKWTSYSINTHEDHVNGESKAKKNICWYHSLLNTDSVLTNQHYVGDPVTDAQIKELNAAIKEENAKKGTKTPTVTKHGDTWGEQDAYKCFGENAKITSQTASGFVMDVTSTGWSANWAPSGKRNEDGTMEYEVKQSNPWGVDAKKVVNVERGRKYTISFKIKSTLQNEIKETKDRKDGTGYNEGTGKYNYTKHIHFKAYDNKADGGPALKLANMKATIGGKNALVKGNKKLNESFDSFVTLDSKNTADDGWVTVSADVVIPSEKEHYQGKAKQATLGIQFALGAFLYEFPDENDMSGTIEIKDFKVTANEIMAKPAKVKSLKVKSTKKKSVTISFKKAKRAQRYEIQYSTKSNFKKATSKITKKTKLNLKLKSKKKYYVRVRGYYTANKKYGEDTAGSKICGKWVKKTVKVK